MIGYNLYGRHDGTTNKWPSLYVKIHKQSQNVLGTVTLIYVT